VGGVAADSVSASAAPAASPQVPATISLYQLVTEVRAARTSTTTTTVSRNVRVPATTTSSTVPVPVPVSQPTGAASSPSTTATTTPLTPLTTLLQQLAPALNALSGSDDGIASWFYAPPGTCAHRDLPLGTVVTITRLATGASTTCRVADRGPTLATRRVIDLSPDVFDKLASRDAGVIEVLLSW
jgi:rare lipoprotein A (peptidoglycan hydrolase)